MVAPSMGGTGDVLIEEGQAAGQMPGNSLWLQSVLIDGSEIGDLIAVEIVAADP